MLTFAGFAAGVRRASAALRAAGVGPGDRVLFLAENSPAWQQVAIAAQVLRAEPVALFAHLGAEPARALAQRVRPRVVLLSTAAQWAKLAPAAAGLAADGLTAVLSAEALPEGALPQGVRAVALGEVLEAPGAPELARDELEALAAAGQGEDPFLLIFTSGTSGRVKGVRVPQRAIVTAVEGGWRSTGRTRHDLGLHFLPFGHVAGHDQFVLALAQGHGLAMIARREDLPRALALRPTYLFAVPMVYERIRDQVRERIAARPGPVRALVATALAAAGRVSAGRGRGARDRLLALAARRLVGAPLRRSLGGRVQGLFAGGAATPPALAAFFEALGLPYVELYGMSETAGLIASNFFDGPRRPGIAGYPTSDLELRLEPDGELCVQGGTLMTGYLDAEDGAGAYTEDGFFRTGDLARLEPDGALEIVGRKKALLVLSTGKKLSPEPIEQAIAAAAPFSGAVLVGDGRPFLAAAVFVTVQELERLGAGGHDPEPALLAAARAPLQGFSEYEKPKRLLVIPGAPTDHPAFVTPSLKVKRDAVLAALAEQVDALYAG